jgi:integrase/recombinase XerD
VVEEHHFVPPPGPLARYGDGYRTHLAELGYSFGSLQHRVVQFNQVSRWLELEGLGASDLDETEAARFAGWRAGRGRRSRISPAGLRPLLAYLRSIGIVEECRAEGRFEDLLAGYYGYLCEERGLADKTVRSHIDAARRFLTSVADGPGELADLRSSQVSSYLLSACADRSAAWAAKRAGSLRCLLRYLHVAAITPTSLVRAVPQVARRRRGPQPCGLEAAEIARLLASCDRRRGVGRRDHAILMLLSRLGLRAGEVAALTLDDIDWRHGELMVRGKGDRHERLPLPAAVGEAVAGYLQRGRPGPPDGSRVVFLRARAPWTPLGQAGVQTVVCHASVRAGLGRFGPRRLRHSAATRMHRAGLPLAAVAQVLRHHDTRVTTVYVDVDEAALVHLARPWPGSEA